PCTTASPCLIARSMQGMQTGFSIGGSAFNKASALVWVAICGTIETCSGDGSDATAFGNEGACPPQPEPLPGLPPEFILMEGPTKVTPLGSTFTKLPPTLSV